MKFDENRYFMNQRTDKQEPSTVHITENADYCLIVQKMFERVKNKASISGTLIYRTQTSKNPGKSQIHKDSNFHVDFINLVTKEKAIETRGT